MAQGAGIQNTIIFAQNADFSGSATIGASGNMLTQDNQIWIGSTAPNAGGTNVNVKTLTAGTNVTFSSTSGALTINSSNSGGTVTSVSGTANQVSVATGATTPVISLIGPYTPATYTAHGVLIGEGTSSIVAAAVGATGTVLQGSTGADPAFTATPTLTSVTFGSGTALSVYQEGTWTPLVTGSSTSGTTTYSAQVGTYTKIGNMCYINGYVIYSAATGTGNIVLSGFPFTINATYIPIGSIQTVGLTYNVGATNVQLAGGAGTTTASIYGSGTGISGTFVAIANSATQLYFSLAYRV